jgi:hypothetical protein
MGVKEILRCIFQVFGHPLRGLGLGLFSDIRNSARQLCGVEPHPFPSLFVIFCL